MRTLFISILVFAVQSLALANQPPVANGQNVWCDGSAPVTGQLTGYDQDGDPLTFSPATPPENGQVVIEPNGAFVYTPDASWDGSDYFGFTASDGNYVSNEAFVNLYVFNRPPVANAGADWHAYTEFPITLQGGGYDPDGEPIIGWNWAVDQAVCTTSCWLLFDELTPTPTFKASVPGDYVLVLIVEDPSGGSAPDFVTVHVADNLPPVAIATADNTTITVGGTVCFDGSMSYDPEGAPLSYTWNFADGSPVVSGQVSACHQFLSVGDFGVGLRVTDERGANDFDFVAITVNPPHIQAYGQVVWCDGSSAVGGQLNATDQNGHPLTYTLTKPPENGNVVIQTDGAFVYTPSSWDGNDRFWFTATDGNYISNEAFVNLYVFNRPPVASAGADLHAYTSVLTTLHGSGYDPDGEPIIGWYWAVDQAACVGCWTLEYETTPTPALTADIPGDYVLMLVVESPTGFSAPDFATVHVADNQPPEAIPTATPSFGEAPLTVQFAANAFDPNEDLLTYAWYFRDAGSGNNNRSTLENPTHLFHHVGFYHVSLDVCDGLATINRSITIRAGIFGIDYLLGDIDFDGDVDFADVNEFTSAYLSENGDPDYNSDADLDCNDGFIDLYDFALLANDWGEVLP